MRTSAALAAAVAALVLTTPAAAQTPAPGAVLVKLRSGARYGPSERKAGAQGAGTPLRGTRVRLMPVSGDPVAAAHRLARARGVTWAEPNWTLHAFGAAPDDPLF